MAAPPAKPSPSNQPVQQTQVSAATTTIATTIATAAKDAYAPDVQLKAPPSYSTAPAAVVAVATNDNAPFPPAAAAAATAAATATTVTSVMPSYTSSESSESYIVAKQLLNEGNFEEALSIIEHELETTKAAIRRLSNDNDDNAAAAVVDVDVHPAIAPLHYLYGTTLLYSLEEAKDDGHDAAAMTTIQPSGEEEEENHHHQDEDDDEDDSKPAAATATTNNDNNPWAHLSEPAAAAVGAASAEPDDSAGPPPAAAGADDAEDMEIAWENFEVARHIVETMLLSTTTIQQQHGCFADDPAMESKLKLDLAQIMLREGDLQRLNGRYTSAVQDYSSCLELRKAYLDKWDRKIADTQFNLGLTYLSSSSDLQKEITTAATDATEGAGNPAAAATPNAALLAKQHWEKGIAAHVECAKTFAGIVAKLCGADPEALLKEISTAKPSAAAGFKTTGLDDDFLSTAAASQTLNTLRKAVTDLIATQPPTDTAAANTVYDIQQVLDEIQETVDESERTMDAVRQASEIRIQAQKQAAALGGPADGTVVSTTEDGVTTSIGFGAGAAAATSTASVSATAAAPQQPMMVVKKKKKRTPEEAEDSKPAAVPDAKRAKTDDEE